MGRVWAIVTAGVLATAPADQAAAGAFTLEPGEGKLFALGMIASGDAYFDRRGRTRARGDYRKLDLQFYSEYGALDGLTVFGAGGMQRIRAEDRGRTERAGPGRSEIGARARLWTDGAWIVSAQGSVVIAGARKSEGIAAIGETDHQVDARALVARTFEVLGKPAFIDVAAGYRLRDGDPADEVRIDVSLGVRCFERLLLIAQNFNQIGTGRWKGPLPLKQRIHKLQAAALFDLTERLQLVGAAFFSPAGRDALDETGATLGLGVKF